MSAKRFVVNLSIKFDTLITRTTVVHCSICTMIFSQKHKVKLWVENEVVFDEWNCCLLGNDTTARGESNHMEALITCRSGAVRPTKTKNLKCFIILESSYSFNDELADHTIQYWNELAAIYCWCRGCYSKTHTLVNFNTLTQSLFSTVAIGLDDYGGGKK